MAYFDCSAGISGDMIIGAMLNAGLDFEKFKNELKKLPLSGYRLESESVLRRHISGTRFSVIVEDKQPPRGLKEIEDIIQSSDLKPPIKAMSLGVFRRLAEVEAAIHGTSPEKIHFHEIGAVDSIIDIVGAFIGFKMLDIKTIYSSKIHLGSGRIDTSHGSLPLPAPATIKLLDGVPVYSTGVEAELTTPTGAALISSLAEEFGPLPEMTLASVGYGAGQRELAIPNVLRLILGSRTQPSQKDEVQMIETNIDDMNPQFYEHIMDTLFKAGALDVFLTPIIMKKNRPGVILSVLAHPRLVADVSRIIFSETTTLGLRISEIKKRSLLTRSILKVPSEWGEVRVKVRVMPDGSESFSPEYDDCKKLAEKHGVPIGSVYDRVKFLALTSRREQK